MIRNTTAVSLQIVKWLPTQVPSSGTVTKFGYVQANVACNTNSAITSGILDLQKAKKLKSVVNYVENPITPLLKQAIGMCDVYPDKNDDTGFYQSGMYSTVQDNLYRDDGFSAYLNGMNERQSHSNNSSMHVQQNAPHTNVPLPPNNTKARVHMSLHLFLLEKGV